MSLFHVTSRENLPNILKDGLTPRLGERASACGESVPAVFVFVDRPSCEDALSSWLGDAFDENDVLAVLELDHTPTTFRQDVDYELAILEPISAQAIVEVLDENLEPLTL